MSNDFLPRAQKKPRGSRLPFAAAAQSAQKNPFDPFICLLRRPHGRPAKLFSAAAKFSTAKMFPRRAARLRAKMANVSSHMRTNRQKGTPSAARMRAGEVLPCPHARLGARARRSEFAICNRRAKIEGAGAPVAFRETFTKNTLRLTLNVKYSTSALFWQANEYKIIKLFS